MEITTKPALLTGPLAAKLNNAVSAAIFEALTNGMNVDEACSVAAHVIADYARHKYGEQYLPHLAEIVIQRGKEPLPTVKRRPMEPVCPNCGRHTTDRTDKTGKRFSHCFGCKADVETHWSAD